MNDLPTPLKRRSQCGDCLRPSRTCICKLGVTVCNSVWVTVLQHPSESRHAKGSAPLLERCLNRCQVVVGEVFSPQMVLGGAWRHSWFVYPETPPVSLGMNNSGRRSPPEQLLLLDGTWRKSRKILHLNPWLLELPRLSLSGHKRSYRIRKSSEPHQLSTFEAAVFALADVEENFDHRPMMTTFEQFLSLYESFVP